MNQKAMYQLTYGLFVLTAKDGDKDNGCIINTATQVTVEPNQILIAVNKQNLTHDMIVKTGKFNVSVLTKDSVFEQYKHWGYQSGRDTDKTETISIKRAENGIIYLTEHVNAYMSADVISTMDLGTHTLFLAKVVEAELLSDNESITYQDYQKDVKPAVKNVDKKKGFICTVCGYIYEGEELPQDFICPICKHPSSDFTKL